jgi:4'-phosphopantetheinyl transferase EntD
VRAELKALFPQVVTGAELARPEDAEPLFDEEQAAIARAVDKRRHEFALGRTCARRALAALGVARQALPANGDRSVRWPDEVWGSITHADGLCAAVAARRSDLAGIGIDAELRGRVTPKLWSHIASAREIAWFESARDAALANERATLLFSAKEAFYKAQFCVSRTFVNFHEVELEFSEEGFCVRLQNEIGGVFEKGREFYGRYVLLSGHAVTGLCIPAQPRDAPP